MSAQDETQPLILSGTITKFLFQNQAGWGVALFKSDEQSNASVKIKGQIGSLQAHVNYELTGEFEDNNKYGKSFNVLSASLGVGKSKTQVINYLSSALFPGIGRQAATLIAEHYQDNVIEKINADPDSLTLVKGLSSQKVSLIQHVLAQIVNQNQLTKIFYEQNLKIDFYNYLKEHSESDTEIDEILTNSFYEYAYDHHLTPFSEVEKVAVYFEKLSVDDPKRLAWAAHNQSEELLYESGNTYTNVKKLTLKLQTYTHQFDSEVIYQGLLKAKELKLLYFIDQRIYSAESWNDENLIATTIKQRIEAQEGLLVDEKVLDSLIAKVEAELAFELKLPEFKYDQEQQQALKMAVEKNFLLLTGGPGTGKTTVIKGIYKLLTYLNDRIKIRVAAPTGRASARLNEIDDHLKATTIHKLLGAEENKTFRFNRDHQFDFDCLILDEASMIENFLFARVSEASLGVEKIILVGDQNQLPSVGYGDLFANLLAVEQLSQVRLTNPYRQENGNGIIDLAYKVLNKEIQTPDDLKRLSNVEVIFDQSVEEQAKTLEELFCKFVKSAPATNLLNIQVIAPFYKGNLGINTLNAILQHSYQEKVLKKTPEVLTSQTLVKKNLRFSQDDKIMYLVNDSDLGLSNGDVGIIESITLVNNHLEDTMVKFNDLTKQFHADNFNFTGLSYACSVHKTQGSEYQNVILVLEKGMNQMFLTNQLIYTAITRAKKSLTILGDFDTFYQGINKRNIVRSTTLTSKIKEQLLASKENNHDY